jgi:hypothetical protein
MAKGLTYVQEEIEASRGVEWSRREWMDVPLQMVFSCSIMVSFPPLWRFKLS